MVKMQPCPHGAESLPGVKVQQQVLLKVTEPVSLESGGGLCVLPLRWLGL